jgi:hypothetical protein
VLHGRLAGEKVDTYATEAAAQQDMERCKQEDAMWQTAKRLVDAAIKTHMATFDVDRATVACCVDSAMGGT